MPSRRGRRPAAQACATACEIACAIAAAALGVTAAADPLTALPDPTRPPGGVPSAAGAAAASASAVAEHSTPRLQSLLLGGAGVQAAVIDGKLVPVGGVLGGWRLLRLTQRSAVLAGAQGRSLTLWLNPGVEWRDAETLPPPARAADPAPALPPAGLRTARAKETPP